MIVVYRSNPKKNFVQMPNQAVFDERLSRLARQVLIEIIARPPGWQSTADQMAADGRRQRGEKAESRASLHKAFAELEACGYMIRTRSRVPKGQPGAGGFMTTLAFYDVPQNGHNQDGVHEGVGRWTPS